MPPRTDRCGAFLPSLRRFTRNMADSRASERPGLAFAGATDTVILVVEPRPQGAWTLGPIRYPSPVGRRCAMRRKPPVFPTSSVSCRFRRGSAHYAGQSSLRFDARRGLSHSESRFATAEWRGRETCRDCFYEVLRLSGWQCLPAVAKACPSRRFWGLAQERAPQRCSMAASRPAHLSGRLATSPIARPIRAAAAEFTRALRARDVTTMTTGAPCAGGLFIAGSYRPETGGRDEICSRRS